LAFSRARSTQYLRLCIRAKRSKGVSACLQQAGRGIGEGEAEVRSLHFSAHPYPTLLEGQGVYRVPAPHGCELGHYFPPFGFPHSEASPVSGGQGFGKLSHFYGGGFPFHQTFLGWMPPTIAFPERNFGLRQGKKDPGRAGDICHVEQLLLLQPVQQPRLFPIMGIHPHPPQGKVLFFESQNHFQAQLGLCLKGNLVGYPALLSPCCILYPRGRKVEAAIH